MRQSSDLGGQRSSVWKIPEILREGEALAVQADVASAELVERTASAFGLDDLVNSAGVQTYGTVVDTAEETWDRTLAVNLKGSTSSPGTRSRR